MPPVQTQDNYHHGDLKADLIRQALKIINKQGVTALTIRKVANQANVSHTACYRHFKSKEALLAAIASQGFEFFLAEMKKDYSETQSALENFKASGQGYIRFAQQHPEHYSLMFSSFKAYAEDDTLVEKSQAAFDFLLYLIRNCQQEQSIRQGDPYQLALVAWAGLHGFCDLNLFEAYPLSSNQTSYNTKHSAEHWITIFQNNLLAGLAPPSNEKG